jgi:hypothetical protein
MEHASDQLVDRLGLAVRWLGESGTALPTGGAAGLPAVLRELEAAGASVPVAVGGIIPPGDEARPARRRRGARLHAHVAFLAACWAAWRGLDTFRRYIRRFVTNPLASLRL